MRIVLISMCTILSCSPEDSQEGKQGEQGIPGKDGNANISVFTYDIENLTWINVGNSNSGYQKLEIQAPNVLTND